MELGHTHKIFRLIAGSITVVLVILVLLGGYDGLSTLFKWRGSAAQTTAPSGNIFMSVGTISTTTGNFTGLHPTMLWVPDGTGFYYPSDQLADGSAMTVQLNLASDRNQAVFLGALYVPISSSTVSVSDGLTVYRADVSNASGYESELHAIQNAIPIVKPNTSDYFRQFPSINPAKEILYSSLGADVYAKVKNKLGTLPANEWNIMVADEKGNTRLITHGLRPKWVDGKRFVFLKDDGIYMYDLGTNTEQLIAASRLSITIVNGFDVSDDGAYMAFSEPGAGELEIYHVLNWNAKIIPVVDQLTFGATEVVFSPHSDFLAALTYVPGSDDGSARIPTIMYYSLVRHSFEEVPVALNPEVVSSIYISDWQE